MPGDANRDGHFSSQDLVAAFLAGKYETDTPAIWEEGDWNGDGRFDSTDFVLALSVSAYEPEFLGANTAPEVRAASDLLDDAMSDELEGELNGDRNANARHKSSWKLDAAVDKLFAYEA